MRVIGGKIMRTRPIEAWVHERLNDAVLCAGHWPVVGPVLWWLWGQWQRVM